MTGAKSFEEHEAEHVRLTILRLLERQPAYQANDSIITDSMARYGFRVSRDRVRVQLDWLAEQDLVRLEKIESIVIATVTGRGVDVAKGHAVATGVKRPSAV